MSVQITSTRIGNLVIPKFPSGLFLTTTSNSDVNSVSLIPLNGLNCGVPTRTTPTITPVTPTTLCENLDQTFLNYQIEIESHQNEAGFVPPLLQPITSAQSSNTSVISSVSSSQDSNGGNNTFVSVVNTKNWQTATTAFNNMPTVVPMNKSENISPPIPTHILAMGNENSCGSSSSSSSSIERKNSGGRRPNKSKGISPEEEERRKIRRERNKQAAARCRKRRLDHTNLLIDETEALEDKKQELEDEVKKVKLQIETLKHILKDHERNCSLRDTESPDDIKPLIIDMDTDSDIINEDKTLSDSDSRTSICEPPSILCSNIIKRGRPNFLPVNSFSEKATGIPILTPSTDIIDSLMPSGTGLTPITSAIVSSCSTQLRSTISLDLTSPEPSVKKLVPL